MTNRNQLPCWNNDLSLKNGQFVAVSRYFEGAMGHLMSTTKEQLTVLAAHFIVMMHTGRVCFYCQRSVFMDKRKFSFTEKPRMNGNFVLLSIPFLFSHN